MSGTFQLEEELKKLPGKPGVYIMHDRTDEIIYVGKAVSLKNRVRQYFRKSTNRSPKVERMVANIDHFEYIVTDSELEALILESNLIKEHRPKYNTMLKDDKSYPYIRVTLGEPFPRVVLARGMKKDSSKYYGPYSNAGAVHDTIDLVQKIFRIRPCDKKLDQKDIRPCLYYHIGQCDAPCAGGITEEEYRKYADRAVSFLNGHVEEEIARLTEKMQKAAAELRFEEAASCRDLIESIRQISERQKITRTDGDDRDVIAIALNTGGTDEERPDRGADSSASGERDAEDRASPERDGASERDAVVQVFFVRGGKMIGREHFYLTARSEEDRGELLRGFITQYYSGTPFIPRELLIPQEVPEMELLSEWLTRQRGSKVVLRVPQKGLQEKMVRLAEENAEMVLSRDLNRLKREKERTVGAVLEIRRLLKLPKLSRMEAFDISNISGYESVGSMVVFEDGKPKKNDYRKFRIKTVVGPDDYASMEEVLTRRFERAAAHSEGFDVLPDLLLMDGGRGQVNVAERVLAQLGIALPVCGMVKDDFHRTRGLYFHNEELPIDRNSEGFHLITRIQDEAHRFAIEYHRLLRSKGQVRSVLDEIPGVGKTRRRALMRAFGSIDEIREATVGTLRDVPSMNEASAQAVWDFFHNNEDHSKEEAANDQNRTDHQDGGGAALKEADAGGQ